MNKKTTIKKAQISKERSASKMKNTLIKKGFPEGKLPKGKVAHHIVPVVENGKTTPSNIKVISEKKHIQIHKNRRKQGRI